MRIPFVFRRPFLILRDLVVDRDRPDLAALRRVEDPEAFVWRILPHAARTFSACIAILPAPVARASAVAYLYCRILDTYEDLIPDRAERDRALEAFVDRFEGDRGSRLRPATSIPASLARDPRDETHVLLVERCERVDRVFSELSGDARQIIIDLVQGMGRGMIESSGLFHEQGGALLTREQMCRYCRHVLGLPILFAVRMLRLHHRGDASVSAELYEDCMLSGELIQIANVTRDIEKDLARGVAYHEDLASDLGRTDARSDPELRERVRRARADLLLLALSRGGAYERMLGELHSPAVSLGRASGVLMLLFTERHYRGCARRVGLDPWRGPDSGLAVLLRSLRCMLSRRASRRIVRGIVQNFDSFLVAHRSVSGEAEVTRS